MKKQLLTLAHQCRRAHREARARRTRPRRLVARRNRLLRAIREANHYQEPVQKDIVRAPRILSLIEAPELTLDLMQRLRRACQPGREVVLDLSQVETISHCAILLLHSKVLDGNAPSQKAKVYARPPKAVGPARIWRESLNGPKKGDPPHPLDRALILGRNRHTHKKVEVSLADFLVKRAMHFLTGSPQPHHAGYRTLVECMSNTFKHADPEKEATENWWVASYPHPGPGPKRWCFVFVDNGVGILESLEIKGFFKRLKQQFGLLPHHETLQDLMEGKIGSRLGLSYRGKGLPGIYKELERGRIQNLVIVANNVHANFADRKYVTLTQPFSGTLLYWELPLPTQPIIL